MQIIQCVNRKFNFILKHPNQIFISCAQLFINFIIMQPKIRKVCIQSGCEQTSFAQIDSNVDSEIHTHHNHIIVDWKQVQQKAQNFTSHTLLAQEIEEVLKHKNQLKQILDQITQKYIEKLANGRFRNLLQGRLAETLQKIKDDTQNDKLSSDDLNQFMNMTTNNTILSQIGTQIDTANIEGLFKIIQRQIECFKQRNASFASQCFIKGWNLYQASKPIQAMQCYNRAIDLDPSNSKFYFQRAFIYHQQNKLDIAELNYHISLYLNPRDSSILTNLGMIQSTKGNYSKAFELYCQAISKDPMDATIYNNRGYINFKQHKYRDALLDLDKSISIQPSKESYVFRSKIYKKLGKMTQFQRDIVSASTL